MDGLQLQQVDRVRPFLREQVAGRLGHARARDRLAVERHQRVPRRIRVVRHRGAGDLARRPRGRLAPVRERFGAVGGARRERDAARPGVGRAGARDGQLLRLADGVAQGARPCAQLVEHVRDQVVRGLHARPVGLEHVRLDEDRGPALQRRVAGREACGRVAEVDAAARIVAAAEAEVRRGKVPLAGQLRHDAAFERLRAPALDRRGRGRSVCEPVGDVVLVVGAVGRVGVDQQFGPPPRVDLRQQRPHLGALGLDVVAVQVQADRRDAPAHLRRTVLVDPVVLAATLVGVRGQHRHHEHDARVEQRCARAQHGDVAHERQAGVLALDLAGVDAVLDEHDGLAGGARGIGRERTFAREHEQRQRAALAGRTEGRQPDPARAGLELAAIAHGFVVVARVLPVAALGARAPVDGQARGHSGTVGSGEGDGGRRRRRRRPQRLQQGPRSQGVRERAGGRGAVRRVVAHGGADAGGERVGGRRRGDERRRRQCDREDGGQRETGAQVHDEAG